MVMITAEEAARQYKHLVESQDVDQVLKEFTDKLKTQMDLDRVILFGSRARGDYKYDSDIDIAVIVKNSPETHREKRILNEKILKISFEIELRTGLVINPVILGVKEYNSSSGATDFIKNVRNDGVEIK